MKKLVFAASFVFILAMGASCKKDYTCTCIVKDSNGAEVSRSSTTVTATKSDAESACDANASNAGGMTMTCEIE